MIFSFSFGEVLFALRSFGDVGGTAFTLGEVSALSGFLGGVGSLAPMVAFLGFATGEGGFAKAEWVKRHLSPFVHRFFTKNLHGVLLTRWCGTCSCGALRCAGRCFGTGGGELYLLFFGDGCELGDLALRGITV
jgi:hypothetical protein